ncbi:hypothetical protein CAPTEDRAFT_225790 [Capitella teleta]|uniref:Kazal-like domain-containing protein n=1 Tax=Capitella teleta TaxID=283909 RepID=R7TT45_CAPTE|nr:hypothetical protein CAPTEDRAFT_225790 [Capitella teleta]|eukprot:ELT94666.1 hypothetical protein CAPTEDRAFT_225790 [Capitella teleta]
MNIRHVFLTQLLAVISIAMATKLERSKQVGYSSALVNQCPECNIRECETVIADDCDGQIVKDECDCCPVCLQDQGLDELFSPPHPAPQNNSCESVTCPRNQICIANIQNIPMCRCPSQFWCKHGSRRPLCSEDGVTFKSRCYLKVDECNTGKKIKIRHKGQCRSGGNLHRRTQARSEKLKEREQRRRDRKKQKQANRERKQTPVVENNNRQEQRFNNRQNEQRLSSRHTEQRPVNRQNKKQKIRGNRRLSGRKTTWGELKKEERRRYKRRFKNGQV